jgi:poly(3-hydroxybutyrate) depolymerase
MQEHMEVEGAGHYGIFAGRRWREMVYPKVLAFIQNHQPKKVAAQAVAPAAVTAVEATQPQTLVSAAPVAKAEVHIESKLVKVSSPTKATAPVTEPMPTDKPAILTMPVPTAAPVAAKTVTPAKAKANIKPKTAPKTQWAAPTKAVVPAVSKVLPKAKAVPVVTPMQPASTKK